MYVACTEEQKKQIEDTGYTVIQYKRAVKTMLETWDKLRHVIDWAAKTLAEVASWLSQIPSRPRRRRRRDVYRVSQALGMSPRRVRKLLHLPRSRC